MVEKGEIEPDFPEDEPAYEASIDEVGETSRIPSSISENLLKSSIGILG